MITTQLKVFVLYMLIPAMSFAQTQGKAPQESFNRYTLIAGKSAVWSDNAIGHRGGMIYYLSVKDFEADSTIRSLNESLKLEGFKVSIISSGKDPILNIECKGNVISSKAMNAIRKCHAGDRIFFEFMRVSRAPANSRFLEPIAVKIVE